MPRIKSKTTTTPKAQKGDTAFGIALLAIIIVPVIAVALFLSGTVGSGASEGQIANYLLAHPMLELPFALSVIVSVAIFWGLLEFAYVLFTGLRQRRLNLGGFAISIMLIGSGIAGIMLFGLTYGLFALIDHFIHIPLGLYDTLYIVLVLLGLPLAGPTLFSLLSQPGSFFHTAASGARNAGSTVLADRQMRKALRTNVALSKPKRRK